MDDIITMEVDNTQTMYRINPGEARTDLYGIGKAGAQVIDLSPLREQQKQAHDDKMREQQYKQARQDKLISDISSLNRGDVRPNDLPYFATKQKDLANFVKQKFMKGGKMTLDDQLEFENQLNGIKQEALVSKDSREQAQSYLKDYHLHPELYDATQDEVNGLNNYLYHPDNMGKWGAVQELPKRYDYGQHVIKDLLPAAEGYAVHNSKRGYEGHTVNQAESMIANDLQDPVKFAQAARDFNRAQDNLGAANPVEYYQKKFAPQLVINKTPALQEWQVNGAGNKKDSELPVTHTIKDDGEEVHITGKNGEELDVFKNKNGDITGGILGGKLTASEKTERDKALADNYTRQKIYDKAVADNEIDPKADPFEPTFIPYKEKNVVLSKAEALKKFHDNMGGLSAEDVFSGKAKANILPIDLRDKTKQNHNASGNGMSDKENRVTVITQSQYDALPKGTKYIDSEGNKATK